MPVRPPMWKNPAPAGRIFVKFYIADFVQICASSLTKIVQE